MFKNSDYALAIKQVRKWGALYGQIGNSYLYLMASNKSRTAIWYFISDDEFDLVHVTCSVTGYTHFSDEVREMFKAFSNKENEPYVKKTWHL
jgi:hypothetical protein